MASIITRSNPDVVIIGAGIVGLWCAKYAHNAGLNVCIYDPDMGKASASHGVIGTLMPHQPTDWTAKKALQLHGLTSLPKHIAALEADTGLSAGYRNTGRLMRIKSPEERQRHERWSAGAEDLWRDAFGKEKASPKWSIADKNPNPEWLADCVSPDGFALETLTARIDPRAMMAVLRTWLEQRGIAIEPIRVTSFAPAHKTIIAAGHTSFPLLADWIAQEPLGKGVKGQAALFKPQKPISPDMPMLFDQGLYVLAHDSGLIAVGSTSENSWEHDTETDAQLGGLIDQATLICPALEGADVVERWAGIRSKAKTREPLVGSIPDHPNMIIASGGFKITFGIAHLMAEAAIGDAIGKPSKNWPDDFKPRPIPSPIPATS